ncbi:MAG TPA: valine--tRNA ligase [Steroidobacteraceae bacterium]|jgi:valyl-tRNA synthetase
MDKSFSPGDIEARLYAHWEAQGYFTPSGEGPAYSIAIPPPNVTGTLHMGHAFQDTIMDALTRFHRMKGDDTLWQPGTDHAGIATQMVVERQLNAAGTSRVELGREEFLRRVWAWKEQSGGTIAQQMRRLGASVDWSRDRFTMDPKLSEVVIDVFVRLYEEGLIYRGKRLVNWDPVLKTALSDLEVAASEEHGHLWHLRYPLSGGGGHLIVATTRPETMLGDVAVAVHPKDERYRHLVGQRVRLPLTDRDIPIVADEFVEVEFGSGCVKITPAHDFNDYELGQRHSLPLINVMTLDATMNDAVPAAYRGLDRFEARKRVLADLDALGLLDRTEPYKLTVPRGDRSNAILEPLLTDQWFVDIKPLAEPALKAVQDGRIRFVPDNWSGVYYEWMNKIKDWCISRQLWWGHRIPAWYDPDGRWYVGRSEPQVRAAHQIPASVSLKQDEDVLDTWFSSALWPFSTLGWPEPTRAFKTYYPTSVLVTGFDIIFFWVARMIMMGLKFAGDVPFRAVYIHGLIRDQDGQKMSKSKGNVIDPLDIVDGISLDALLAKRTAGLMQPQMKPAIERATRKQFPSGIAAYGTDALRLCFARLATQSRDLRFDMARVEEYRNFCNKLWNAARFVLMNVEGHPIGAQGSQWSVADRWIRARQRAMLERIESGFAEYRLDVVANALYDFTWHEYCDWYLEFSKSVLQSDSAGEASKTAARYTLIHTLETLLRALHPIAPFISEEIWQRVRTAANLPGTTIMRAPFPRAEEIDADPSAEAEMRWVMGFILGVRQIRGEMDIAPSKKLPVLLQNANAQDLEYLGRNQLLLLRLAGIETPEVLGAQVAPISAVALIGTLEVLVPMAGLIDPAAELERLAKRLKKAETDLGKLEVKLGNSDFAKNAPPEIVAKDTQRIAELRAEIAQLSAQAARVRKLQGN